MTKRKRGGAGVTIGPESLLAEAEAQLPALMERMEELVRAESPSDNKAAVDRALHMTAGWAQADGATVRWYRHAHHADSLLLRYPPEPEIASSAGALPVLLLGHLDTVWPVGTLATMPWRSSTDRIEGPGVLDMKCGVAMALSALQLLVKARALPQPVLVLLHGDEEIGSPASRPLTEEVARQCRAVFVLEPAQGVEGACKTARKGVGHYRLEVSGIGSHSGVDFEAGHSAVLELARQLERVASFTDLERGITVNPGVIGGGTLANVVAAHAWAEIDVRIARLGDGARMERKLRSLRPTDGACRLMLTGGINRPPMERSRSTVTLYRQARALATAMGWELGEASTGGGSDGNFTAALGVRTLDGLGAVGGGAHAAHEHVVRAHLVPRTALLAGLLQGL